MTFSPKIRGIAVSIGALGLAALASAQFSPQTAPPPQNPLQAQSQTVPPVVPSSISANGIQFPAQPGAPPGQYQPIQAGAIPSGMAPIGGAGAGQIPQQAGVQGDLSKINDAGLRSRLEKIAREKIVRPAQLVTAEPWLSASGEQLAGVVGDRQLTLAQLQQRVAAVMTQAPPVDDGTLPPDQVAALAEQRKAAYENQILGDWIENTTLAVYAQKFNLTATDAEVQKALDDLSQQSAGGSAPGAGVAPDRAKQMVGFREADLRQEIKDGILAEKVVRRGIGEVVTEDKMRLMYQTRPDLFFIPARVRAWQIYYPVVHRLSPTEEKDLKAKLNGWRKKLVKAKTQDDFAALRKELGDTNALLQRDAAFVKMDEMRKDAADPSALRQAGAQVAALGDPEKPVLVDLGWVSNGDTMPVALQQNLFQLGVGETSEIFQSDSTMRSLGYNVVKVLERVKGEQGTYEQAKPRIENMVFDQIKDMVYQAARQTLDVQSDRTGLLKFKNIDPTPIPAAPLAVTTREPDLAALRKDANPQSGEAALLAPVPSVNEALRIRPSQASPTLPPSQPRDFPAPPRSTPPPLQEIPAVKLP